MGTIAEPAAVAVSLYGVWNAYKMKQMNTLQVRFLNVKES